MAIDHNDDGRLEMPDDLDLDSLEEQWRDQQMQSSPGLSDDMPEIGVLPMPDLPPLDLGLSTGDETPVFPEEELNIPPLIIPPIDENIELLDGDAETPAFDMDAYNISLGLPNLPPLDVNLDEDNAETVALSASDLGLGPNMQIAPYLPEEDDDAMRTEALSMEDVVELLDRQRPVQKQEVEEEKTASKIPIIIGIVAVVLIVAGVGVYFFLNSGTTTTQEQKPKPKVEAEKPKPKPLTFKEALAKNLKLNKGFFATNLNLDGDKYLPPEDGILLTLTQSELLVNMKPILDTAILEITDEEGDAEEGETPENDEATATMAEGDVQEGAQKEETHTKDRFLIKELKTALDQIEDTSIPIVLFPNMESKYQIIYRVFYTAHIQGRSFYLAGKNEDELDPNKQVRAIRLKAWKWSSDPGSELDEPPVLTLKVLPVEDTDEEFYALLVGPYINETPEEAQPTPSEDQVENSENKGENKKDDQKADKKGDKKDKKDDKKADKDKKGEEKTADQEAAQDDATQNTEETGPKIEEVKIALSDDDADAENFDQILAKAFEHNEEPTDILVQFDLNVTADVMSKVIIHLVGTEDQPKFKDIYLQPLR